MGSISVPMIDVGNIGDRKGLVAFGVVGVCTRIICTEMKSIQHRYTTQNRQ